MVKEFRTFVLRGNVVDLAIGVAIGAAFSTVITRVNEGLITPLISLIPGLQLEEEAFTIGGQTFLWGAVVQALFSFLLTAAVLFFFVVKPVNRLRRMFEGDVPETPPSTKKCPECLSEVPIAAARCSHCTQPIPAAAS